MDDVGDVGDVDDVYVDVNVNGDTAVVCCTLWIL